MLKNKIFNVLKILFTTVCGQFLLIAIIPYITKSVSVNEIATYGLLFGFSNFFGQIIGLRLENLVLIGSENLERKSLSSVTLLLSIINALVVTFVLLIIYDDWIFIISCFICIVLVSVQNILLNYYNYAEKYNLISIAKIIRPLLEVVFCVAFIQLKIEYWLCLPLSYFLVFMFFALKEKLFNFVEVSGLLKKVVVDNYSYIKYDLISAFSYNGSAYFPIIAIEKIYGDLYVAIFTLIMRLVIGPVNIIIASVSFVTRREIISIVLMTKEGARNSIWNMFLSLVLCSFMICILIYSVLSIGIVRDLIGDEYYVIFDFIPFFIFVAFFKIFSVPISYVYLAGKRVKCNMHWQLFGFLSTLALCTYSYLYNPSFEYFTWSYTCVYAFFYLSYFLFSFKYLLCLGSSHES